MAHVAIAGAGPAGAALAHVLARTGNQVTLVERQRDFAREFRGEVLMPSGVDVLHQLGLGEAFARVPQRIPQGVELYRDRKCVASVPFDLDDDAVAIVVNPNGNSDEDILAAAKSCPVDAIILTHKETGERIWPLREKRFERKD